MTQGWRFQQIGVGVSRCPSDSDQGIMLREEIASERHANPAYVVMPSDHDAWIYEKARLANQDRALGEVSWIPKPLGIA